MDAYTLARMFRDYKQVNNKNSQKAKNIILFNGGFHNNRYQNFLEVILGFNVDYSSKISLNSCVDVKGMKLPVFNSSVIFSKNPKNHGGK